MEKSISPQNSLKNSNQEVNNISNENTINQNQEKINQNNDLNSNNNEEEEIKENDVQYEIMKYNDFKKRHFKDYGIYHFTLPTPHERKSSFDCSGETTLFNKLISHQYTKFYYPMPAPGPNDWLMSHKEYGQTYREYIRFGYHQITNKKNVIYIAPLCFNINPAFDQGFITAMIVLAQDYYYDMKVKLLNMNLNLDGVEYRNYEDGSYQLNANTIIEKLFNEMPDDGYCLLCLTDVDLYNDVRVIKPRKWIYYPPPYKNDFCYELDSFKYWVGICSICRFDPNFILEKKPEDENCKIKLYFSLLKRSAKLVIKNLGHMLGMRNCIFFKCVMNAFGNMQEFDERPMELCPCCLRKAFTNISRKNERLEEGRVKNDVLILQRFQKLKESLENNFFGIFEDEVKWYEKRIDSFRPELPSELFI